MQHVARLQSIQVLVPEFLIWILYLCTRFLTPPLCLEVKMLSSQHSLYTQSILAYNTAHLLCPVRAISQSRVISPGSCGYLPSHFIIEELSPEIFLAQCVGHKLVVRALHVRLLLEYLLHDDWRQLQGDLQVSTSFLPRYNAMEIPSG